MDKLPDALEKYVEAVMHEWATTSEKGVKNYARAAILAFLNAAEKDGWAMVPREATETMLEAVIPFPEELVKEREAEAGNLQYRERMTAAVQVERLALLQRYRAMLDAAKEEDK